MRSITHVSPKEWPLDAPRYATFSHRMALRRASLCLFPIEWPLDAPRYASLTSLGTPYLPTTLGTSYLPTTLGIYPPEVYQEGYPPCCPMYTRRDTHHAALYTTLGTPPAHIPP